MYVLYVLYSRRLLKMSSKRFYTAEKVAAISVADVPWHENGNDVSKTHHMKKTEKNFT